MSRENYFNKMMTNSEKRFIDVEELASYLDISKNTVYSWVNQRRIPCFKIGRLVKFDLNEIETWIKTKRLKVSNKIT